MAFNSTTSRMPGGITNAAPWQTMGNSGVPDPSWAHVFHDDFDKYNAADWSVGLIGTGTNALVATSDGGQIISTTTAAVNDAVTTRPNASAFQIANPTPALQKSSYFKWSGFVSDALNSNLNWGWMSIASLLAPVDGIYINSPSGGAGLRLILVKASAQQIIPFPAGCVITNGVPFEIGIEVDSGGNVAAYFNPSTGNNPNLAQFTQTGGRGRVASILGPVLTNAFLAPGIALQTSTAAAKTMTTDFMTAVKER